MANLTTTNVDLGNVIIEGVADKDETIALGAPTTILEGTILARDSASGLMVLFVKGGVTNENGIPKAVLTYEVDGIAGVNAFRVMQSGKVNFNRLVIAADGDNTNVDSVVMDELRDYGIETVSVQDLSLLDNQ